MSANDSRRQQPKKSDNKEGDSGSPEAVVKKKITNKVRMPADLLCLNMFTHVRTFGWGRHDVSNNSNPRPAFKLEILGHC